MSSDLLAIVLFLGFASLPPLAAAQGSTGPEQDARGGAEAEAFRLMPGDEIEIAVAGIPELTHRAMVDFAGDLALPLGDPIGASGLTLSELRIAVRSAMSDQVIQKQGAAGFVAITVLADKVSVQIAQYRPVYLMGDVDTPGEQAFRPGMTARQAIATGGGFDVLRINRPFALEAANLIGRIDGLRVSLAREEVRNGFLRRQAGMDPAPEPDFHVSAAAPEAAAAFREIEREWAAERVAQDVRRLNYFADLKGLIEVQRGRLIEQREIGDEAVRQDSEELRRLQELSDRGLSAVTRLTDARRALKSSTEDFLDTTLALGNLERDEKTVTEEIDSIKAKSRTQYLQELGDSEQRLREIRSNLSSAVHTLGIVEGLPDGMDADMEALARVRIARFVDGAEQRFVAGQDTLLRPGDVVEVDVPGNFGGL